MGHPQVLVKREWTKAQVALDSAAPVGPSPRQLAGSHILDLAACGKMILLCDFCNPKFVPKGVGYVRWWDTPIVGTCDGCREFSRYAHGFIPEPLHSQVGAYGRGKRPRSGRWRGEK